MNKAVVAVIAVVVILIGAYVIYTQVTMPVSVGVPAVSVSEGAPNNAPVAPVAQSPGSAAPGQSVPAKTSSAPAVSGNIGQTAASQISDLVKAWGKSNGGSYAGFLDSKANSSAMTKVFISLKSTIDFYVYSTKSHFVVRTYVANDSSAYCMDDSLSSVKQVARGDDSTFRAQKDCSGKAL